MEKEFYIIKMEKKRYEGDYFKGKKEGSGKLYYENEKPKYIGLFSNDQFEGVGIYFTKEGEYYSGIFHDGLRNGYCEIYDKEGKLTFNGNFINDEYESQIGFFFNSIKNKIHNLGFNKK